MNVRNYTIDLSNDNTAAIQILNMHRDTLLDIKSRNPDPNKDWSELNWEVRLYEFMLKDPVKRLKEYNETRFIENRALTKRKVVKKLGWVVP